MKTLIIPTILFIISIVVNGISLIQPNSDKFASLAVIILLISIGLAITAVYKLGKSWTLRKRLIIQISTTLLMILFYLVISSRFIMYNVHKNPIEKSSSQNSIEKSRAELLVEINKSFESIAEQSNGLYSVEASYKGDEFCILYKFAVENDIALNDKPIDALVEELTKTFKENGTIDLLKSLEFRFLKLTYKALSQETERKLDLNKI